MAYIKNISHEEVLHLADQVSADKGQIVSKTLAQNGHVSVTLFAFSKDEEIATHDSTGDAMVLVLEGTGQFTVDGKEYILQAGDTLVMPAKNLILFTQKKTLSGFSLLYFLHKGIL